MNLYFAPLACSLATRIAFYEAGKDIHYTQVDLKAKRLADGTNYFRINPMGQVPALRTDDRKMLTENSAVLQFVGGLFPESGLVPADEIGRIQLARWLGFISTELHKTIFAPIFDGKAPEDVKAYARGKAPQRLDVLQNHLAGHEFLLDHFTVADAYLVTVLNWAASSNIDLREWPAVNEYHGRLLQRPSIAQAVREERQLYEQEQRAVSS
ncbi:MAG TPA: glutathione binding-like protein [Woeseiaceae bacterium]|nr:glutathione binding-like protein [Woeseiaceae bacterium]